MTASHRVIAGRSPRKPPNVGTPDEGYFLHETFYFPATENRVVFPNKSTEEATHTHSERENDTERDTHRERDRETHRERTIESG